MIHDITRRHHSSSSSKIVSLKTIYNVNSFIQFIKHYTEKKQFYIMSKQVIYQIVKNNSSFLRKQRNANKYVEFSADPNNLTQINSSRFNGLGAKNAVGISVPKDSKAKAVLTLASKESNKPKRSVTAYPLKKSNKLSAKDVADRVAGYRDDLKSVAALRWAKITTSRKTRAQKRRERVGKRAQRAAARAAEAEEEEEDDDLPTLEE